MIEEHTGDRAELRALFALADDSPSAIARYLEAGSVLVARDDGRVVGHVQLVPTGDAAVAEIASVAVDPAWQRCGLGARLVRAALERARATAVQRVRLATATADIGNLRFCQRLGFRMVRIEPDAFTPETGYPHDAMIDGIPLRDRVWFEILLSP